MRQLLFGGFLGLMLGLALQLCGLARGREVRLCLAGRRGRMARALLFSLGLASVMTALLMWLAVIDTDDIPVTALSGSLLTGGLLCGVGLGLAGGAAENALAALGGGSPVEGLCMALGCAVAVAAYPYLPPARAWLDGLFPAAEGTLFQVTLHRPFLVGGGFLGQGCLGAALMALALCIRKEPLSAPAPAPAPEEPPTSIDPVDVRGETFVASLPGEEPVVVDTEPAAEPPRGEAGGSGSPRPEGGAGNLGPADAADRQSSPDNRLHKDGGKEADSDHRDGDGAGEAVQADAAPINAEPADFLPPDAPAAPAPMDAAASPASLDASRHMDVMGQSVPPNPPAGQAALTNPQQEGTAHTSAGQAESTEAPHQDGAGSPDPTSAPAHQAAPIASHPLDSSATSSSPIFQADEALVPQERGDAEGAPPGDPLDVTPGTDVSPIEQAAEALQPRSPFQAAVMSPEAVLPPETRKKGGKGKKRKKPRA